MKKALILAALLTAAPASAAPITLGYWTLAPMPNEAGLAPFAQPSEDGPGMNIWYVLGAMPGLEYLTGPFTFTGWQGTNVFQLTAYWAEDVFAQTPDGAFTLHSPEGFYTSNGAGSGNFLLLRRLLTTTTTQYWACGEDHDGITHRRDDCNDIVQTYIETIPGDGGGGGGQPVPEPASLALCGAAAVGCARRLRRRG